jgi:hypothetical protein
MNLSNYFGLKKIHGPSLLLLIIPLILCAVTHIWNPVGFPFGPSNDEGIYMRRAMHVLKGLGPQESSLYDHPYFSQLFLAGALGLIGYPHILNPSPDDVHSVETLWLVPRILMGLLAVVDTFLIYKISHLYYNRKVAFVASILFAVMPISWFIRRIWLEPIQLPFLLASILFAVYSKRSSIISIPRPKHIKNIIIILLSGIFLGLAIFTKIPAFTMIPLVGFLIYTNTRTRGLKSLGFWFIPVIIIPLIWPLYALSIGHFDLWWKGAVWQSHRGPNTLFSSFLYDFNIDPLFTTLAIAGLIFAAIKRDFFLLLWLIPFVIFLYVIGFVSFWHFTPLLPAACVAAARMIEFLSNKISSNNTRIRQIWSPYVIISGIGLFGLITSCIIIAGSNNSTFIGASAFANQFLEHYLSGGNNSNTSRMIAVISNPFYLWIPQYVFHFNGWYSGYYDRLPSADGNILLIVDASFKDVLNRHDDTKQVQKNFGLYTRNDKIAMFQGTEPREHVTIYHYSQTIYFHILNISNIGSGEDIKFTTTNLATGHYQVYTTRITPANNSHSIASLGGFPSGATLIGCMTNLSTLRTSCDDETVATPRIDFYVSAR